MEQQLAALQDQLSLMLLRYTPDHPDVLKLRSQIEALKRRISGDTRTKSPIDPAQAKLHEPPQIQQLRVRIRQDDLNIADLTTSQNQIQEHIRVLQVRVQTSPMVEENTKN